MCTHKTLLLLCLALFAASVNAGAVSQRLCSVNSVAGCNTHSMCAHLTNGQCEQHDGQCGYQCSCQAGWEGDKCDQKMACDTDLCNGNGTGGGNKVDGCTCMCDEGFAGDRCEIAADEEFVVVDEAANGVDGTGWSNTKVGTGYQHHTNTNMHGPWGSDVRSVERTFQIGSNTCGAQCTVSWVQYGEHTRDNEWDRVYVNDVEVGSEQMYHSTRTQKAGTWTGACSNALTLRFTSDLDQALADEGWGFGGVKVVRHACTASATKWDLGMNINPSDGHNFGWAAEWDDTGDVGSDSQAFNQDYKKQDVWAGVPVKYIAIVRHDGATCQASKVWKLDDQTKTMYDWLKDEDPGRHRVTSSGPVFEDVPANLPSKAIDPIFAEDGNLIFNWWYSNNGARIAVDETYVHGALPGTSDNSDDLHGLGNEFGAHTQSGQGSSQWWHDVSVVQPDCHGTPCKVQGTDHGTYLRNGDVSFSYAIYVSDSGASTASFPCQGKTLARAYSGTTALSGHLIANEASAWRGKNGAAASGNFGIHLGREAIGFNGCTGGGDLFSAYTFTGTKKVHFEFAGAEGGFMGYAEDYPGSHYWPIATQAYGTQRIRLHSDSQWRAYTDTVTCEYEQCRIMIEDFVAPCGNVYFRNFRIED